MLSKPCAHHHSGHLPLPTHLRRRLRLPLRRHQTVPAQVPRRLLRPGNLGVPLPHARPGRQCPSRLPIRLPARRGRHHGPRGHLALRGRLVL